MAGTAKSAGKVSRCGRLARTSSTFLTPYQADFRHICKVSSIMRAKVLSIMPVKGMAVTSD
jgi:hypothetical protein